MGSAKSALKAWKNRICISYQALTWVLAAEDVLLVRRPKLYPLTITHAETRRSRTQLLPPFPPLWSHWFIFVPFLVELPITIQIRIVIASRMLQSQALAARVHVVHFFVLANDLLAFGGYHSRHRSLGDDKLLQQLLALVEGIPEARLPREEVGAGLHQLGDVQDVGRGHGLVEKWSVKFAHFEIGFKSN